MRPRGSMSHTQGLSNSPYPELNQSSESSSTAYEGRSAG